MRLRTVLPGPCVHPWSLWLPFWLRARQGSFSCAPRNCDPGIWHPRAAGPAEQSVPDHPTLSLHPRQPVRHKQVLLGAPTPCLGRFAHRSQVHRVLACICWHILTRRSELARGVVCTGQRAFPQSLVVEGVGTCPATSARLPSITTAFPEEGTAAEPRTGQESGSTDGEWEVLPSIWGSVGGRSLGRAWGRGHRAAETVLGAGTRAGVGVGV